MQLNFHNTLQCREISLAYVQENRTELAFKVLEFPKGRAEKGLGPEAEIFQQKYCITDTFYTKDTRTRQFLFSESPP